jgi:2-polyprenyl-6-methoxyphenol hydroxylase-like FAD-dependent oxidoreductase
MAHVIVVGAGPAGASLALLLAQRGVAVTLLERHTDFAREFRGELLLPGGLEALVQMGVWPFLLSTVSDRVTEWSRPGLLVIGDAAHTMSPVGAQGINIALRDAIVAANHLVPALRGGADPLAIDAASRAVQAERVPEVEAIQRLQARAPRIVLNDAWWAQLVLRVLPLLLRPGAGEAARSGLFRRFAFGVTDVKLTV